MPDQFKPADASYHRAEALKNEQMAREWLNAPERAAVFANLAVMHAQLGVAATNLALCDSHMTLTRALDWNSSTQDVLAAATRDRQSP